MRVSFSSSSTSSYNSKVNKTNAGSSKCERGMLSISICKEINVDYAHMRTYLKFIDDFFFKFKFLTDWKFRKETRWFNVRLYIFSCIHCAPNNACFLFNLIWRLIVRLRKKKKEKCLIRTLDVLCVYYGQVDRYFY